MRSRYAVVLTHDRPEDFRDCMSAILPQVDRVFVVSHAAPYTRFLPSVTVIPFYAPTLADMNISRAWNFGLDRAHVWAQGQPYDVAVLNDDAIVPPDWFRVVTEAMRRAGAAAGSGARCFDARMSGYAFVLDGTKDIRADEQFEWWYGDDDIERQARALGGVVQVPGVDVEHRHPNGTTTGVLAEKTVRDSLRFQRKWAT